MTATEIDALCEDAAQATGLPVAWVRHHVDQRAGRPCRRCGGTGQVSYGTCFRCNGLGGRANPQSVTGALAWIRANVSRIRELAAQREAHAPDVARDRRHKHAVKVQAWKKDHYDVWDIVNGMLPCDFKSSITKAVEAGKVTEKQEKSLQKMADAKKKKEVPAPPVGTTIATGAVILSALLQFDGRKQSVFRIEFETVEGWRGRVDTTDEKIVTKVQSRRRDGIDVYGVVEWKKEGYAIVAGRVEVISATTSQPQ